MADISSPFTMSTIFNIWRLTYKKITTLVLVGHSGQYKKIRYYLIILAHDKFGGNDFEKFSHLVNETFGILSQQHNLLQVQRVT